VTNEMNSFDHYLPLYSSLHIIRVIKLRTMVWAGFVAHIGEMRNTYKILVWTPWGKRLCGRHG